MILFIFTGNVLRSEMPPVNEIAIVSGQINANVSGSFSISGNVLNMNTSISGNVINVVQSTTSLGDPIVLTGSITVNSVGTQLPNIPVSSGVVFFPNAGSADNLTIGGLGSNLAVASPNPTGTVGYKITTNPSPVFAVTNLNQLSAANDVSGRSFGYFAVTISG